jgi:hypothetical protein
MKLVRIRNGFPRVQDGITNCPCCGDVCHETVGASSNCAPDSVRVSINFHCISGCCWELHIVSEEGDLEAHCVLMGIHEELREQRHSEFGTA